MEKRSKPKNRKRKREVEDVEKQSAKSSQSNLRNLLKLNNGYFALLVPNTRTSTKYLYIKEHKGTIVGGLEGNDRTLFVTNLDFDSTEKDLSSLFSKFGEVQDVYLDSFVDITQVERGGKEGKSKLVNDGSKQRDVLKEKEKMNIFKPRGPEKLSFIRGGYAHVIFSKKKALKKVFKGKLRIEFDSIEKGKERCLREKWLTEYRNLYNITPKEMQKEVDEFIWAFDKKNYLHKKRIEELTSTPDDEGWVTVTSTGKHRTAGAGGVKMGTAAITPETIRKLKEKEEILTRSNFYQFQKKEKKEERLAELRKKFQDDKNRIQKMKEGRKFKPFG